MHSAHAWWMWHGAMRRRGLVLVAATVVCSVCVLSSGGAPAWGHTSLLHSELRGGAGPQHPIELAFTFSEDLDPAFSTVRILDARGAVVDPGPGTIDPLDPAALTVSIAHLAVDSYVAAIRVRSADGHFVEERVPFQIGSGSSELVGLPPLGAVDPAGVLPSLTETLSRWLSLIGAALAGGAVTFALVVRQPGGRENLAADADLSVWLRRLLLGGALAVIAGSCLLVVAQAATGAGVPWWGVFGRALGRELGAHAGRILSVRAITALFLAVVAWRLLVSSPAPRAPWALAAPAAALMLATFTLGGHAPEALAQSSVPIALDYVHMAAMTAWLGGLPALALATRVARGRPEAAPWLSQLVRRFSGLALVCVLYLGVSGMYAFSLDVRSLAPLGGTTYGRVMLVKLSLFAVLICLGGVNRLLVIPGLSGPPSASGEADLSGERAERAAGHLRWTVRAELVAGSLVLLAVGALTSLAPGTVAWAAHQRMGPSQTVTVDHVRMTLRLAPGALGDNSLAVDVVDGRTGAGGVSAHVTVKMPPGQGVLDLPATGRDDSGRERYSTDSFPIASAGPIALDVTLERDGFRPVEHVFTLVVGAAGP